MVGMGIREFYVGNDAQKKRSILNLSTPIQRDCVVSWPDLEKLIHYTASELFSLNLSETHLLFTLPVFAHAHDREKLTELMFESYNVPSFYLACASAMSLFAVGRRNGIVVFSGDSITHSVPCYEGHALLHATHQFNFGDKDITEKLQLLLEERGCNFTTARERAAVGKMKEALAFVKPKYCPPSDQFEKKYKAVSDSDDEELVLCNERWQCTESLFGSQEFDGIHQLLHQSIFKCDPDLRADLYSNIVLSGESMLLPGITSRLHEELSHLIPPSTKIRIHPAQKDQAFTGASMFASQPDFRKMSITNAEYKECGSRVVNYKCF